MQVLAVLLVCLAAAQAGLIPAGIIPATTLVRTPSLDSAVIKSDRLGGNFAYEVHEGHAYAAVSPVISHVRTPVAVTNHVVAPATYAYAAPAVSVAAAPYALPYGIHGIAAPGVVVA